MAKTAWRTFQDEQRNRGWRIPWIPINESETLEWQPTNYPAAGAAIGFLLGIVYFFSQMLRDPPGETATWGIALAVLCLPVMFVSLLFYARWRRRNWVRVVSRCVDREIRRAMHKGRPSYEARVVCEFKLNGESYRATPVVHYLSFRHEGEMKRFLDEHIGIDGACPLYVNPELPRECELTNQGLKEWLLYAGRRQPLLEDASYSSDFK